MRNIQGREKDTGKRRNHELTMLRKAAVFLDAKNRALFDDDL